MTRQKATKAEARTETKSKTTEGELPAAVGRPSKRASRGKRGAGEGTVTQRADGRWMARLSVGRDASGKLVRKCLYGSTRGAVIEKLRSLQQQLKHAPKSVISKGTLGEYLRAWVEDVRLNRAAQTWEQYAYVVEKLVIPFIGGVRLSALDADVLQKWQTALARAKASGGHSARRLGTDHIRHTAVRILSVGLNRAVRMRLLSHNPAVAVTRPRIRKQKVQPLEVIDVQRVCQAAAGFRLGQAVEIAIHCGLRRGEVFGLRWVDVNLREGILTVRHALEEVGSRKQLKSPKTDAGRRVIPLTSGATDALKRRMAEAVEEGLPPGECDLVFPDTTGGFQGQSNFDKRVWRPIRNRAGLPAGFRFHDLRHGFASLSLAAGIDLKVLQQLMGHESYTLTAGTYAHLLQNSRAEAVQKLDAFLQSKTGG
jgi:integrase